MNFRLLCGPANSGKIAAVVDAFVAAAEEGGAWLVVPTRADVRRARLEVARRVPALVGASVGTFRELARAIDPVGEAREVGRGAAPVAVRRLLRGMPDAFPEQRWPGFARTAARRLGELRVASLASEPLPPGATPAETAAWRGLLQQWEAWLDERGLTDDAGILARAVAAAEAGARPGPVWVYGFDDLDPLQEQLLVAVARHDRVGLSLPYEAGRAVFERRAQLVERLLTAGAELDVAGEAAFDAPGLAALAAGLFEPSAPPATAANASALELVTVAGQLQEAEATVRAAADAIAAGAPPGEVAVLTSLSGGYRLLLEHAFRRAGVPIVLEAPRQLRLTPAGRALRVGLAALGSPQDPLLQAAARSLPQLAPCVAHEGVIALAAARDATDARDGAQEARELIRAMSPENIGDVRVLTAALDALAKLEDTVGHGTLSPRDVVELIDGISLPAPEERPEGAVVIAPITRVRTDRFDTVILGNLHSGGLDVADEDDLDVRPLLARERAYVAVTRARRKLVAVRQATDDEARQLAPHPLWRELERLVPDAAHTGLTSADVVVPPHLARTRPDAVGAAALALGRGHTVELPSAADADELSTVAAITGATAAPLGPPRAPEQTSSRIAMRMAERDRVSVTGLESYATCPAMWLIDRELMPRGEEASGDAASRGTLVHRLLEEHAAAIESGTVPVLDDLREQTRSIARSFPPQERPSAPVQERVARQVHAFLSAEPAAGRRVFTEVLLSDLEGPAPEIAGLALSGRIDRLDIGDDGSAVIHDYKTGSVGADRSAANHARNGHLQLGLYWDALAGRRLPDGPELRPIAATYRQVLGPDDKRATRGLIDRDNPVDLPGINRVEAKASDVLVDARDAVQRAAADVIADMRAGNVAAAPRNDTCPTWCSRHPICRIRDLRRDAAAAGPGEQR